MWGEFSFSLRISATPDRRRKAGQPRSECRERTGAGGVPGYCSIHQATAGGEPALGSDLSRFLVSIIEQLACISHLLIC